MTIMMKTPLFEVYCMHIHGFLHVFIIITVLLAGSAPSYAVSAAVKTQNDYIYSLDHLRNVRIIVENYGNEDQKKQYDDIKIQFNGASEDFYAQNYSSSYQKFYNVKERLAALMENIAAMYISRTQQILDSTSKASFDIIIKYSNSGGLKKYFAKPYNPVEDIKPYKEDEYHFFYDKKTIERYLHGGYKKLQDAKNIMNDPDLQMIKAKKTRTSSNLDFILSKYSDVISTCRLSKQYGIEIHKLLKTHQIGDILRKYNLESAALDPIFDDRIPEEFKVDANDNLKLIHSIEKERLIKNNSVNR